MFALLEGMTIPLLSASKGFDVPFGVNPLVQLHQREMCCPRAWPIRCGRCRRRRGGGDTFQITIHAMDGASVQRVVESDSFRRAIRESRRNGHQ